MDTDRPLRRAVLSTAAVAIVLLLGAGSDLRTQPIELDTDSISLRAAAEPFRYVFDIPGGYINDHSLIFDGSRWHLFFIQGTVSKEQGWFREGNETTIGHAVSFDLLTWTREAPALTVGEPGSPDDGHVYAPSVVERDGIYYMIYSGNRQWFTEGEYLFLAESRDLFTWKRLSGTPLFLPDSSWALYRPHRSDAQFPEPVAGRDPFLLYDSAYGYICYYISAMKRDPGRRSSDNEYACIAAATSPDLIHWTHRGPVLIRPRSDFDSYSYGFTESPCIVKRENLYYLFWKGGSGTRYVISRSPLDFHDRTDYFLATSHASKVIRFRDRWYLTSCSREPDDIGHTRSDRTRGLYLAELIWRNDHPFPIAPDSTALAP